MIERLQIPIPMWRIQYQLLGGHRRMGGIVLVTAFALFAGALGIQRISNISLAVVLGGALTILTWVQVGVVLFGGCNAIHRAVQRDFDSRMVESHRLSPMSSFGVVMGYLFGPTLQVLALFALFTFAGAIACYLAGVPVDSWVLGNLALIVGTLPIWSVAVFFGQRTTKPFNPIPILMGAGALTWVLVYLPAGAFLLNIYPVVIGIWYMAHQASLNGAAIAVSITGSGLYTMYWIYIAAIKFRRPDLPALNGLRGLALVLVTMIFGAIGLLILSLPDVPARLLIRDADTHAAQWIGTMVTGLLLCFVVISGTVQSRLLGQRGTALRSRWDRMPAWIVVILAVAAVIVPMLLIGTQLQRIPASRFFQLDMPDEFRTAWLLCTAAMLISAWSAASLIEIGHRLMKSARLPIFLYCLLIMGGPPLFDSIRAEILREGGTSLSYSWVIGCSPVGVMIATWTGVEVPLAPGLALQTVFAGLLTLCVMLLRRRRP